MTTNHDDHLDKTPSGLFARAAFAADDKHVINVRREAAQMTPEHVKARAITVMTMSLHEDALLGLLYNALREHAAAGTLTEDRLGIEWDSWNRSRGKLLHAAIDFEATELFEADYSGADVNDRAALEALHEAVRDAQEGPQP
jgi:hypothetical protein